MALAGLDILAVDAYGAPGHVALDTLRRHLGDAAGPSPPRRSPASSGSCAPRSRTASSSRPAWPSGAATTRRERRAPIRVQTVSAGFDTAVRVSAPDRPGLLHDLAQAVSATGLNIRWAKVLTVDGMAIDTFHVVDADGGPVDDDGVLGHLVMRMREIR